MKWDNTSGLSSEVEKQLNDQIQKWLDENPNPEEGVNSQDTRTLIVDLYAIYKGANSPLEKARLQSEIIQKGAGWDTDNPALAQIQKYVNRLMKGQYNAANDYLSEANKHNADTKSKGKQELRKELATKGAIKKHSSTNEIKQKAIQHYQENRDSYPSKKVAAIDLAEKFPPLSKDTYKDLLKKY